MVRNPGSAITYGSWRDSVWQFLRDVREWAGAHPGAAICDVGGGANPLLPAELRSGRRYVVVDIDPKELDKAPGDVERVVADMAAPDVVPIGRFGLVVSRHVAEHVGDAPRFHRNVRELLDPRGTAIHHFPTYWALPFVLNGVAPERVTRPMLLRAQPHRGNEGHFGKFPARYRWCRGPTRRQLGRLTSCGYDVVRYQAYFGHGYYEKLPALMALEDRKAAFLIRHPMPSLTAFANVTLRRR